MFYCSYKFVCFLVKFKYLIDNRISIGAKTSEVQQELGLRDLGLFARDCIRVWVLENLSMTIEDILEKIKSNEGLLKHVPASFENYLLRLHSDSKLKLAIAYLYLSRVDYARGATDKGRVLEILSEKSEEEMINGPDY